MMENPAMLVPRDAMKLVKVHGCHEGRGELLCIEMLAQYERRTPGCMFVHEDHLAPGASIGEHTHTKDEELYIILDGEGEMLIDKQPRAVRSGDLCYTLPGHSHSLTAGPLRPMRFLVIGIKT